MNALIILNEPPYGTERSYNGLRLAGSLAKRDGVTVRVFLMGDAASCANSGQQLPTGYYNIERMLHAAVQRGAEVAVCGTCMDARGLADADLTAGARRGTLEQLTDWTVWANQVLTF
jgi:uncharacterized protein involved in oxidation of intracellular sulfur